MNGGFLIIVYGVVTVLIRRIPALIHSYLEISFGAFTFQHMYW
nr:MAG TPA: hypothetical protein [Caudoviricetes sp.]